MIELAFVLLVALALFFDFVNGFHDSSNAVATVISTRALSARQAILLSAFFNFIGPFLFGTAVAHTIGTGIVAPEAITSAVIAAALAGAVAWSLATWYLGIPSSSSHALVGGLAGSVIMAQGVGAVNLSGLLTILASLVISPVFGIAGGFLLMIVLFRVFRRSNPAALNNKFKHLQVLSSSAISLSHGTNDAQKTMGVIAAALVTFGYSKEFFIPMWVVALCALSIALGTMVGGWRIIKTMGGRIVKLRPIHGFSAETSSAAIILASSLFGMPVSTTHVVSSSIMGVGASQRLTSVRWGIARQILVAWVLTLPISALLAAIFYAAFRLA
jgi:PiT family inorganic phosphate transporter